MMVTMVYDDSEAVELSALYHLYLKPKAKLIITVMLPEGIDPCRPISNWEILEQIKSFVAPDYFSSIKVSRSTKEFIRIDAEADTKSLAQIFLEKLNGQTIQINSFSEQSLIEVTEAPIDSPSISELPSLLPETENDPDSIAMTDSASPCIHLEGLPCKWFVFSGSPIEKPSEDILKSVFEKFGKLLNLDIPMLDPYREDSIANSNPLNSGSLNTFDAFLQYEDNTNLISAVQSLQGMKLMFTGDDGKSLACDMKVTLDTTRHFSEEAVSKRNSERCKLQELEQQRKQEKKKEEAERKRKIQERKLRIKKRRAKLKKKAQKQKVCEENIVNEPEPCPEDGVEDSPEWEERKLLLAHRRVEAIKLLTLLFDKVNDEIQKNRLNEEQTDDLFLEDCSGYSISTLSENEKQIFQTASDEEESNPSEIIDELKDKPYDPEEEIYFDETPKHKRKTKQKSQAIKSDCNPEYDCATVQMEVKDDSEFVEKQDFSHNILKMSHSQDFLDEHCCKRLKVYETDEFIHYILNYYHCPEYARIFLHTEDDESNSWCQRVVHCSGNGFQVRLKNMNYYTEMKFHPELCPETDHGSSRWKVTIQQPQERCSRKNLKTNQKHMVKEHQKVSVSRTKSKFYKDHEYPHGSVVGVFSQNSESDNELKDVLEEISSTSEYFSEELSEATRKQSHARKISRKKTKTLRKSKPYRNSNKTRICHHEDILGHFLHSCSACKNLKKQSKYNYSRRCHKSRVKLRCETGTSETGTSETETSEISASETGSTLSGNSESDVSEEERKSMNRKKLKKTIPTRCLKLGKKSSKAKHIRSMPFLSETSSSDSHIHRGRKSQNGKSKAEHMTMCTKALRKSKREPEESESSFSEDESESFDHNGQLWEYKKPQKWSNVNFGRPSDVSVRKTEQLDICHNKSLNDYLDWEKQFYSGKGCLKNVKYKS